jgi:hypothetical protein
MKKVLVLFTLLSAAVLVSCADGNSGVPPGGGSGGFGAFGAGPAGACNFGTMCVEVYGAAEELKSVCGYGGEFVDRCSTEGLVSKCQISAQAISEVVFFYDSFGFDAATYEQQCHTGGGTVVK